MDEESSQKPIIDNSQVSLLLVDDEPNILTALKRLFRPLGYQIFTAGSGAEGLKIMEAQPIDLIISDMRMPNMDGAAFFESVVNRWPSAVRILLTGHADMGSAISAINKGKIYRYVSKPWEDNDLKLTVQSGLEQKFLEQERRRLERTVFQQNEELQEFNARLEDKVSQRTAELAEAHEALKKNYMHTVKMFANLIELREALPAGYSSQVGEHAKALAILLGVPDGVADDVLYAGMLHDIGKMGLSDALLMKPFDMLSPEELRAFREHPLAAQRILVILDPLQEAGRLIRHHRESFDGSGYPDGLKGDEIPLGSRVVSVVNDYYALQAGLLYGEKYSAIRARQYLNEYSGMRYDPNVVNGFMKLLDEEETRLGMAAWMDISSEDLKPGMKLAKDMVAKDGVLLLIKGYLLDTNMIRKIRTFEKLLGSKLSIQVERN